MWKIQFAILFEHSPEETSIMSTKCHKKMGMEPWNAKSKQRKKYFTQPHSHQTGLFCMQEWNNLIGGLGFEKRFQFRKSDQLRKVRNRITYKINFQSCFSIPVCAFIVISKDARRRNITLVQSTHTHTHTHTKRSHESHLLLCKHWIELSFSHSYKVLTLLTVIDTCVVLSPCTLR